MFSFLFCTTKLVKKQQIHFHKLDRLRGEPQTWRPVDFSGSIDLWLSKFVPLQRENLLEYALKQS